MKTLLDILGRLSLFISAICVISMTAIITYQVVARYIFNDSPAWSERLSLVLLAYLVFFGAASGVYQKFHIRIDALRNAVPDWLGRGFEALAHVAVAIAGLIMMVAGTQLTTALWDFAIPALGVPRGIALLPLMFAGGLICLFSVANLAELMTSDSSKA
ncbi:MAG: TRAP transporter small permease [Aquisalinus sp.]|nr:TRAP transporter small permease [Aquisalinus sp.]